MPSACAFGGFPAGPVFRVEMKLTAEEQKLIARKAIWYFDCYFGMNTDDSVVFTGDGVDDLDVLISRLTKAAEEGGIGVNARFLADTGTTWESWKAFDVEDVQAIRQYYVAIYGEANKPPVLERNQLPGGDAALQL